MNDLDQKLFTQLRFKLLNNNIYFHVIHDIILEESTFPVKPGADLIRSGVLMKAESDVFTFIVIYQLKVEDEAKEDDGFGLVDIDIRVLLDMMKKGDIIAYYVNRRSPDKEIENLLKWQKESAVNDSVQTRIV